MMDAALFGKVYEQKKESPNILERYNKNPLKEFKEGMTATEMAEIISDRLIEFTRNQIEANNKKEAAPK